MMTLLSPASLWTLAALALPLAIHLWRRPPRTVRLGSLRFLQGHSRRLQNLRWREHALLFARLGLLTFLALGLAQPHRRQPPPTYPQRWALLDPAAAPGGLALDRLRALQSAGVETRRLAPGFPTVAATAPADPAAPAPDLWSLLREADATLPVGSVLTAFSPGRLAALRGVRPVLARVRVEWVDTLATSPAAGSAATLPPVAPLTVLILHDPDRAEEARYLAAAWRAVSQADHRPLTLSVAPTTGTPPASGPVADWIFWLGPFARASPRRCPRRERSRRCVRPSDCRHPGRLDRPPRPARQQSIRRFASGNVDCPSTGRSFGPMVLANRS